MTLQPCGLTVPYGPTALRPYGPAALRLYSSTALRPYGFTALRPYAATAPRPYGPMALRPYGPTALRPYSPTALWPHGSMAPWPHGLPICKKCCVANLRKMLCAFSKTRVFKTHQRFKKKHYQYVIALSKTRRVFENAIGDLLRLRFGKLAFFPN